MWVKDNAARFGLVTGYTGRGGPGDEPHHVEPISTSGLKGGALNTKGKGGKGKSTTKATATKATATKANVSKSSGSSGSSPVARKQTIPSYGAVMSASASKNSAGGGSSEVLSGFKIIAGIDKPYNLSSSAASLAQGGGQFTGGDPIDDMSSGGSYGGGGGGAGSIVISPNIYLNGGQDLSNDIHRIAKEVGRLLESEVKLVMMRQR
jgi:hypothetical protein